MTGKKTFPPSYCKTEHNLPSLLKLNIREPGKNVWIIERGMLFTLTITVRVSRNLQRNPFREQWWVETSLKFCNITTLGSFMQTWSHWNCIDSCPFVFYYMSLALTSWLIMLNWHVKFKSIKLLYWVWSNHFITFLISFSFCMRKESIHIF